MHVEGGGGERHLDEHRITTKQLQLLHCFHIESNNGVVIVYSFVHNQTIRSFLPFQDCCREIFLRRWLPAPTKRYEHFLKSENNTLTSLDHRRRGRQVEASATTEHENPAKKLSITQPYVS
jgi:hypothetical protein